MTFKASFLPLFLLLVTFLSTAQTSSKVLNDSEITVLKASYQSILKQTENTENHKTLLAVMRASRLEDILGYDGPFTVFAPSDSAFKKLSKSKLDELLTSSNKEELRVLMTSHIVAGNFSASSILKKMCRGSGTAIFTTVQGENLIASMQGVDIVLTDKSGNTAKITAADSNHCNGVIHEIDSVFRAVKI